MPKHLYLILISTFIFGVISGGILYLQNNTGNEGDGSLETSERGFTIMAYQYGGCTKTGCDSYRIENNGSYTYILRENAREDLRFEAAVTTRQRSTLRELFKETRFDVVEASVFNEQCPADIDGVAFRYDVTIEGVRYAFDSCVHDIEDEPLFETLTDYFEIFNSTHNSR